MSRKMIYISWDGPYSYKEIENKKEKGIYQVYSSHPVYGEDTLVYIGKTDNDFSQRLKNREILTIGADVKNIKVYLGVLYCESIYEKIDYSKDLEIAETLLINYHSPAKNSSIINSCKYAKDDITIVNRGNYKMLHQSISSKAFYQDESAFAEVDSLAKILVSNPIKDVIDKYVYYGYYLDEDKSLWVGLDVNYWKNDAVLVFQSKKKINDLFKITSEPEWYYKELKGSKEDIIKEVKEYINQ